GDAAVHASRNDVLYPPPAHDVFGDLSQAGSGLEAGLNGVCVTEHGEGYFAPVLVFASVLTNWTHVAIVYRDNRPRLYLNGKPVHEGLRSKYTVHCGVGLRHIRGMAPFRGALGAFQRFDRALTETEVEELMKAMPIPKLPPASPALEIARSDSGHFNVKAWRGGNYGARMADGKRLSWNVPAVPEPFEFKGS